MIRLTSMAVAMLIGVAPMAQAMTCSERMAELSKKMESVINETVQEEAAKHEPALSEAAKQEAAKHLAQAKEAMANNDESGCMSHVESGLNMMHGD